MKYIDIYDIKLLVLMNLSFMTYTATADAIKTTGLCQVLFRLFMVMLCVVLCILFEERSEFVVLEVS